jgi:hypothetical protein
VLLAIPAHLLLLWVPLGNDSQVRSTYYSLHIRCWDYPKCARNSLDEKPLAATTVDWGKNTYTFSGDQARVLPPRPLMLCLNGTWEVMEGAILPYSFISYTNTHFCRDDPEACRRLERLAEKMTKEADLKAYWLDRLCMEKEEGPEFTDDVHRICDVIRGAVQICVLVLDLHKESLCQWGARMWTLPEGLLSQMANIKFCSAESSMEMSKIALAANVWKDGETSRLLAEHFTGLLTLSRLELISLGLEALGNREMKEYTPGDLAYALMSLLK